ncbi:hypothetical protein [Cohnella mopanensis]|uniref:hypothetical protein n=1 Tax=Cohnella mopanensis TaxID=2911966 RepID=UPI001EF8BE72|nr:hypothetical protein [Cohnella mopanensis]
MKRSQDRIKIGITVLVLSLALAACSDKSTGSDSPSPTPTSSSTPAPTETASSTPDEQNDELILKQFRDLAMANPTADQLFASFKQSIVDVQPAQADDFIRALEAYYKKNLPEAEQKFEADQVQQKLMQMKWPITDQQIQEIKDDSTRELVQQTVAGGYKLETAEGFVFPVVDYGQLLTYADKLSISMKAYLDVMATESDSATASDGGLIISWDELASRTLAAESYVVTFPDTPERAAIEQRYLNYLTLYLIGLDNTPIFDYDTFIILPEVKKQYEQMAASHAGTITGQMAKGMLAILNESKGAVFTKDKNGEQVDIPEMKQFRDKIQSSARSKLPAGKN